jgi:hypothetical protein
MKTVDYTNLKHGGVMEKPFIVRVLPDIFAFGIGLSAAWLLKWETGDLVWSLWLSSLVLGYLTLLSAIGAGALLGIHALNDKGFKKEKKLPFILIGAAGGLFFLGFFSLHFCGFHAGHSVFLNQFFPVEGIPKDGFGRAFMNPPLLWFMVGKHLLLPYGAFLVPALIAERRHVFAPMVKAIKTLRNGEPADFTSLMQPQRSKQRQSGRRAHPAGDIMGRPYKNVIRMHLLIFFFAGCHFLKVDSFIVYSVVYFVYFFPWGEFRRSQADRDGCSRKPQE